MPSIWLYNCVSFMGHQAKLPTRSGEDPKKGFNAIARLEDIESEVDGVFCSNVLEHISDDREILEKLNSKMKVGAKLLVYVPAFMMLFSDLDRKVGHYRRYGKKEMVSKPNESGFRIDKDSLRRFHRIHRIIISEIEE